MANKHDRMPKPTCEQQKKKKNKALSQGLLIATFVRVLEGHSVKVYRCYLIF